MKLRNNSDIQHVGTINKSIDFGIDKENIGILFRGFSDTLYSNKIGSIVRELTSNCFDSHREAGIEDDVVIAMVEADPLTGKNGKISFKDIGIGLSPIRIQDIYSKYFSSTKRETDNEIGGFGIGAKSPLAYTDVFEVNTIYEGIKYFYVVHRGDKVPHIKLINQEETKEHNGTEVILPVRSGDESKFRTECKHQLRFFSNIHYINMDINDDYKVVQGKHWIASSHSRGHYTDYRLSLCLGGVSYPIDFNQVEIDTIVSHYSQTTVALKFNIGDVDVTMSRESIEYNDRTIQAIKEKYLLAAQELKELYSKSWENVTDFREYFINANKRRHETMLPVKDDFIDISFCIKDADTPIFKPWDLAVTTNDLNLILKTYQIVNGKRDMKKYDNYPTELLKKHSIDKWFRKKGKLQLLKSEYIHDELVDDNIFICAEIAPEPDFETEWYRNKEEEKEHYLKVKPLLLRYLIDNTLSYDTIEVPDSYKPVSYPAVKAKVPRTQVCARYTRFDGEYNRHDPSDVMFSKQNYMYDGIEKLINTGHTIIYSNMEDEWALRQLAFVITALPEWRSSKQYDEMHRQHIHVHKIANSHMKHYKTLGALTPKEFIVKNYNQLMGISMCDLLGTMYRDNRKLFDPIYGVFPKGMESMMMHCTSYREAYRNLGDDPLWKIWTNPRYGRFGSSISNDGNHVKALKSLCEKYDIPYNTENHVLHFGKWQLHTDSFFKLFKEVVEELGWIDQYFNIVTDDKESLLEDKALSIIKEIPSRNYSKLMYKIKNYFKNE